MCSRFCGIRPRISATGDIEMNKRLQAAEAYVLAMRTGEFPAVAEASKALAKDVKLTGATVWGRSGATVEGHDEVLYRITGVWPNTPVYVRGYWSEAKEDGDKVKVDCHVPGHGRGAGSGQPDLLL